MATLLPRVSKSSGSGTPDSAQDPIQVHQRWGEVMDGWVGGAMRSGEGIQYIPCVSQCRVFAFRRPQSGEH